jgi:hypothetical protein
MNISERAAYIEGLMEGLDLKKDSKESKLLCELVKLVKEICSEVSTMKADFEELDLKVDELDEDLGELEEQYYGEDDNDEYCGDFDDFFGLRCPSCGKEHVMRYTDLSEDELEGGIIKCPSCGKDVDLDECLLLEGMDSDGCCSCGDSSDCSDDCGCGCKSDKN